jgi:NAD(P)H-dependent FMN reductase
VQLAPLRTDCRYLLLLLSLTFAKDGFAVVLSVFNYTTTLHYNSMSSFLVISGSPSKLSRNSFLLAGLKRRLEPYRTTLSMAHASELQPFAPGATERLTDLIPVVRNAQAVLLVTPVPSEDWSGCLKTLLQFLPAGSFRHRPILLIGTSGSMDELPDLERSLDRELIRLSGHLALSSIHVGPKNWVFSNSQPPWLTAGTELRLNRALEQLHSLTAEAVTVS